MKLVALSDLHLGYRAYAATAPGGANQREIDVLSTFARTIDRVIACAPDLVVIAGDIFHSPKPSPRAVLAAFIGFKRLVDALQSTIVVVCCGNHDLSKTNDGDDIMPLLGQLGLHIAERSALRFHFPDRDLSVLAVPDAPGLVRPPLTPDSAARFNVLVLHGDVQGVKQGGAEYRPSMTEITPDELGAERWSFCAFGHYHQYEMLAPNAAYSGSIDFTSSNIWGEIATPKGFVLRDLDTGAHSFEVVPPARRVVNLETIDATGMAPADVNAAIAAAVASVGGIDDAVARIRIVGITREVSYALDQKALRSYKKRALHFKLVEDRPDRVRPESLAMVKRFKTLDEEVAERMQSAELQAGVDRGELVALGQSYLQRAAEKLPTETVANEPPSKDRQPARAVA